MSEEKYCILRNRFGRGSTVVQTGLTLDEAQAHCQLSHTRGEGWFDGYTLESNRQSDVDAFERELETSNDW